MTVEDIALTLQPRIGHVTAAHLISHFGSAKAVFGASVDELIRRAELNPLLAQELVKRKFHSQAEKELTTIEKLGIRAIASTDDNFPLWLRDINDYPHVIYTKGNIDCLAKHSSKIISVVGTRKATEYGRKVCDRLISELAEAVPELVVISGLASGIDSFVHRAAVLCRRPTFGVIATSLTAKPSEENRLLINEMLNTGGGVITEYHTQFISQKYNFAARNRIVAGISAATLLVESPINGGSMLTAAYADGYNRDVLAVPGRIDSTNSFGTNNLIRSSKARMVLTVRDIIEELGWEALSAKKKPETPSLLSPDEESILAFIREGDVMDIDTLAYKCNRPVSEVNAITLVMEMEGLIRRLPGNVLEGR